MWRAVILAFSSAVIVLVVIADFLGIFVEKRRKSLDPFKIPWNAKKLFRDERFTTVS